MPTPAQPLRQVETFIDEPILAIYKELQQRHNWAENKYYNEWFYSNKPEIPKSTVRRWTRSFTSGQAHSATPDWHLRYRDDTSIIPLHFSDIRNGRWQEEQARLHRDNKLIKYVNTGDFHVPYNDGALLSLLAMVVEDFKPNVFPFFCDWLEQDRFSPHALRPFNANLVEDTPTNKYNEFETLTNQLIDLFSSVIPADCLRINLWGNHEDFVLRHLFNVGVNNNDNDLTEFLVTKIFNRFHDKDILWLEPDRNLYIPLTNLFWVSHGRLSRTGEGSTAKSYMNKMKYSVSVAAQHTHRQETLWTTTPTGERFYAICGTLSNRIRSWNRSDYQAHNWGFQLIQHPVNGWRGSHVEDVRIHLENGYYICSAMGEQYSIKATETQETLLIERIIT